MEEAFKISEDIFIKLFDLTTKSYCGFVSCASSVAWAPLDFSKNSKRNYSIFGILLELVPLLELEMVWTPLN